MVLRTYAARHFLAGVLNMLSQERTVYGVDDTTLLSGRLMRTLQAGLSFT